MDIRKKIEFIIFCTKTLYNKEPYSYYQKLQKLEAEILRAKKELLFQNQEKLKRAEELDVANFELIFQNEEKLKRAEELVIFKRALREAKKCQKELIQGLSKMMFIVSHKLRLSVSHILGLSSLLGTHVNSQDDSKKIIGFIKKSSQSLDDSTTELTNCISEQKNKVQDWV